jgi:hypothetical protein
MAAKQYLFSDEDVDPWLYRFIKEAKVVLLTVPDEKTQKLLTLPNIPKPAIITSVFDVIGFSLTSAAQYWHHPLVGDNFLIISVDPVYKVDPLNMNKNRYLDVPLQRIVPVLAVLERTTEHRLKPNSCALL